MALVSQKFWHFSLVLILRSLKVVCRKVYKIIPLFSPDSKLNIFVPYYDLRSILKDYNRNNRNPFLYIFCVCVCVCVRACVRALSLAFLVSHGTF